MILKEDTFTYKNFKELLSNEEVNTYLELARYMTEDNLLYLYQKSQRHEAVIDRIAKTLGVSRKTIQNRISSIIKKQHENRYFLYKPNSTIKGEYFLSPELVLKDYRYYDIIYKEILPKLEKEAIAP